MNYLFASVTAVIGVANLKLAYDFDSNLAKVIGIVAFILCLIFIWKGEKQADEAIERYNQ